MKLFFAENLSETLITEENIVDIIKVMSSVKSDNLRAVMFACQKTSDIVNRYEDALDFNFIRFLLCSLIAYACRIKNGKCKKWENNESSPANLGTATFPLYRVCYDYINNQRFDKSKFKESQESYLRQKRYENNKSEFNKWFEELRRFYDNTEENVSKAVGQIKELLSKNDGVDVSEYGMLANYLIAVRDCISNVDDIDKCKELMLRNIQSIRDSSNIEHDITYHDGIELENVQQREEFAGFKKKLLETLKNKNNITLFGDDANNIEEFLNYAYAHRDEIIGKGSFVKDMNIAGFVNFLKNCSAKKIGDIRRVFRSMYSSVNIGEFLSGDKTDIYI